MDRMSTHRRRINWRAIGRTTGIVTVTAILGLLTLGLLAAAGASSYDNLFHLAASRGVPIPRLSPLEIDVGLVVVVALDIVLTWLGHPIGGLRLLARILGIGTIAANVAAGWPDPVGASMRAFAPVIIVAVTEALRAFLLRRHRDEEEEGIPFARWMLAPWPTFVLWRRMKLWNVRGYCAAVDMELSRREAIVKLRMRFGDNWKSAAPEHVVWKLRRGVRMAEALAQVAELTAPVPQVSPQPVSPGVADSDTEGEGSAARQSSRRKSGSATPKQTIPDDIDTQAEALRILGEDPDISGSELGRMLGTTPGYGRTLKRRLTQVAPGGGR